MVSVIVSPEPIGSPVVSQADAVLILDDPSLAKFEPKARPGGLLIINDCLVRKEPSRDDLRLHRIAGGRVVVAWPGVLAHD